MLGKQISCVHGDREQGKGPTQDKWARHFRGNRVSCLGAYLICPAANNRNRLDLRGRPSGSHPLFGSSVGQDKLGFVFDAVAFLPFRLHCKITTSHGYRPQEQRPQRPARIAAISAAISLLWGHGGTALLVALQVFYTSSKRSNSSSSSSYSRSFACPTPDETRVLGLTFTSSCRSLFRQALYNVSKAVELVLGDGRDEEDARRWNSARTKSDESEEDEDEDGPSLMSEDERKDMRRKIREVLDTNLNVEEETDPVQRRIKMQKLLADYPLVVEEEDPNWPEDADGRGFNLDQFFNKITIKNVRNDDDDHNYESDKEVVWQDDNYILPIKDITAREWEDTVFKDFNPLNEKARNELERAVEMFWESGLPSPRCVAIDACVEHDLVDALQVSIYPEILFTKAGKILHRDKVVRSADEWSKIMAFFYYKAVRPTCLDKTAGKNQEKIPSLS
ncbi:hypothetical protein MUK42_24905 [Musa troglodytarum]|uniref:Uncharacterized protein n=1 Tax=Musa troglodytarum TaxID=320322 RepID=A0A9E7FYF6_9LILI|nr:hypothetical protein MUK42_24905 [Musa troglodytarum]URE02229.1 hypothetical protein MUK42_24905 [Musa troglodytarum]